MEKKGNQDAHPEKRASNLRNSRDGNVGFQTPGLTAVNAGFQENIKKNGKKPDRYGADNLHSEIAEEDINKFSPQNKNKNIVESMDDVNALAKEGILLKNSNAKHTVKNSP